MKTLNIFNAVLIFGIINTSPILSQNLDNMTLTDLEQDSVALVALYNSTDGDNWTDNTNWLTGAVNTWFGITVTGNRVTGIDLRNNNLVGELPPEIGDLNQLTSLVVNSNQLSGPIPVEICNLTELEYLYLSYNTFTDTIPSQIGNLTKILRFFLGQNQFSGTIPIEIGDMTSLQQLFLDANELEGSIPPEIGNLSNLTDLHLANNQLTDTIPHQIGNLANLNWITLHNNHLTGAIPNSFQNLNKLDNCILYNNQFTDLPDLSTLAELTRLEVQLNQLTFEDIEPNISISEFEYTPQDSVGEARDTTLSQGSNLVLSTSVGGTANQYQWTKDGVDISGANGTSYTINSAIPADSGSYLCKITNSIATELTLYSKPIHVTISDDVGISDHSISVPKDFSLGQNYPNPFNPETTIPFNVKTHCHVTLKVFDLKGREIAILMNSKLEPGQYKVTFNSRELSSGLYFYTIRMKDFYDVKKMVVLD